MNLPAISHHCTTALNWIQGKREPTRMERLQQAVTLVAKMILSGLIIAGITYGGGSMLMAAGTTVSASTMLPTYVAVPLQWCGAGLLQTGTAVAAFGRTIFLTITVPLYAVFYQFPTTILPQAGPYLKIAADCISAVATQAFTQLSYIASAMADNVCAFVATVYTALQPYLQSIASSISTLANMAWDGIVCVATPVINFAAQCLSTGYEALQYAVRWVATEVLSPALQMLAKGISAVWSTVYPYLQQAATAICSTFTWVTTEVLSPALQTIASGLSAVWAYVYAGMQYVGAALSSTFTWVTTEVLSPALQAIASGLSAVWTYVYAGMQYVGAALSSAFTWVATEVLSPALQTIASGLSAVWAYVYAGMQYVGTALSSAFTWVATNVLSPTLHAIASGLSAVWTTIYAMGQQIGLMASYTWTQISTTLSPLMQRIANVIGTVFTECIAGIAVVAEAVRQHVIAPAGASIRNGVSAAGDLITSTAESIKQYMF